MVNQKIVHTVCGVLLLGVLWASTTAAAFDTRRTTHFTFSGAVQLPGVTLPAGSYTFEVVNSNGGSDVVSVRSRDRAKLYLLRITRGVDRRTAPTLDATITLGETRPGTAPRIKAWFPKSETRGREFIY
jgi:hypothetical protein